MGGEPKSGTQREPGAEVAMLRGNSMGKKRKRAGLLSPAMQRACEKLGGEGGADDVNRIIKMARKNTSDHRLRQAVSQSLSASGQGTKEPGISQRGKRRNPATGQWSSNSALWLETAHSSMLDAVTCGEAKALLSAVAPPRQRIDKPANQVDPLYEPGADSQLLDVYKQDNKSAWCPYALKQLGTRPPASNPKQWLLGLAEKMRSFHPKQLVGPPSRMFFVVYDTHSSGGRLLTGQDTHIDQDAPGGACSILLENKSGAPGLFVGWQDKGIHHEPMGSATERSSIAVCAMTPHWVKPLYRTKRRVSFNIFYAGESK